VANDSPALPRLQQHPPDRWLIPSCAYRVTSTPGAPNNDGTATAATRSRRSARPRLCRQCRSVPSFENGRTAFVARALNRHPRTHAAQMWKESTRSRSGRRRLTTAGARTSAQAPRRARSPCPPASPATVASGPLRRSSTSTATSGRLRMFSSRFEVRNTARSRRGALDRQDRHDGPLRARAPAS
jgi:hypothetical protein